MALVWLLIISGPSRYSCPPPHLVSEPRRLPGDGCQPRWCGVGARLRSGSVLVEQRRGGGWRAHLGVAPGAFIGALVSVLVRAHLVCGGPLLLARPVARPRRDACRRMAVSHRSAGWCSALDTKRQPGSISPARSTWLSVSVVRLCFCPLQADYDANEVQNGREDAQNERPFQTLVRTRDDPPVHERNARSNEASQDDGSLALP